MEYTANGEEYVVGVKVSEQSDMNERDEIIRIVYQNEIARIYGIVVLWVENREYSTEVFDCAFCLEDTHTFWS